MLRYISIGEFTAMGSTPRLPPSRALVAFEAAGRNLNFTKAADELLVTRVAVSRQIKLLEEHLRTPLFIREPRRLRLTTAGERLYRVVNASFNQIMEITEELSRNSTSNIITLATTPGVSIYWLMPRIGDFRRLHPEIDFRISTGTELADLAREGIDLAIRYGSGDWTGTESAFLGYQNVVPTCSAAYFKGRARMKNADDLLDENLLHFDTAYDRGSTWEKWFFDQGVTYRNDHRQSRFTDFVNLVQALLDGQGIALVGPPILQQFYDNGMLVRPLDITPLRLKAYYLVWPTRAPISPAARSFMDWVTAELAQDPISSKPLPLSMET